MRFFREVVLEQVPGPVVCFLDEIDSTLKLPWTDDLFTALRGMHNERPLVPAYERLTFCLIGVACAERADQGPPHDALQRRQHAGAAGLRPRARRPHAADATRLAPIPSRAGA